MLLAIDARNRSVSLGFREGESWLVRKRLGAAPERTADEFAFFLEAARLEAAAAAGGSAAVDRAIVSSVVPVLGGRILDAVRSAFGLEARLVGPGVRTGIKIRTDLPSEVGGDLVCAALAARELVTRAGGGPPVVIVDFGAAISVSAVNAAGEFLGAAFAPGLETAVEALHGRAALLPEVRLEAPLRAIGRSTAESLRSGLVHGYAGLVERLVDLFRAELAADSPAARPAAVVGTGDEAGRSILASAGHATFVPELALEGLAIIAGLEGRE